MPRGAYRGQTGKLEPKHRDRDGSEMESMTRGTKDERGRRRGGGASHLAAQPPSRKGGARGAGGGEGREWGPEARAPPRG